MWRRLTLETAISRQAKENLVVGLLAALCAVAQFRLIAMMFQVWYGRAAEAANGVVIGMPHWRSYQSRILGPYMAEAFSKLFPSYLSAHVFVSIGALTIAGFFAWRLGRTLANHLMGAALSFTTFHILFAFCLTLPWIYIWDYLSVAIFSAFVLFVIRERSWRWFAGLFAIAIFNRENALFIALWMIIDPVVRHVLGRRKLITMQPVDRSMIAAGVFCVASGLALTEFLRRALLVREVGYELFRDAPETHFSMVQLQLFNNFGSLIHALTTLDYNMQFVIVAMVLMMVGAAVYMACVDPLRWAGLGLVQLTIVFAILLVGVLPETRLYVELIPFLTSAVVVAAARFSSNPA